MRRTCRSGSGRGWLPTSCSATRARPGPRPPGCGGSVGRVAAHSRTIRIPAHVWELAGRLRAAEAQLRNDLGGDPSDAEIAERAGLTPARAQEIRQALRDTTSLDQPVGEDGETTLSDLLPDRDGEDPALLATEGDTVHLLRTALSYLDPRERLILILRFGLDGNGPRTLESIGEQVGLTRERIRQMQNRALARLRQSARLRDLSEPSLGADDVVA